MRGRVGSLAVTILANSAENAGDLSDNVAEKVANGELTDAATGASSGSVYDVPADSLNF